MATKTTRKKKTPWEKPAPKKSKATHLAGKDKSAARSRAKRSGRKYPNLVDNMWAASRKKSSGGKKPTSKKSGGTKRTARKRTTKS